MNWYARALAQHSYVVIVIVAIVSGICVIVPITTRKMPGFTDPTLGFETRGTIISQRITTWQNLAESTRPSGPLTSNPSELFIMSSKDMPNMTENISTTISVPNIPKDQANEKKKTNDVYVTPPPVSISSDQIYDQDQHKNWTFGVNVSEPQPDFGNSSDPLNILRHELSDRNSPTDHDHDHLSKDGFFCGAPSPEYAHMVVSTTDESNFLSLAALHSGCRLDFLLRQNPHFSSNCQTSRGNTCCHSWTLPNYIAVLHGHSDCLQIEEHEVNETRNLLIKCAQYYHSTKLPEDCQEDKFSSSKGCFNVPPECTRNNAVYNILHYLVDVNFLPPKNDSQVFVRQSMLFLPMASSSAMMPYYDALNSSSLHFGNVKVVAMDLGLKSILFDESLVRDTWLISLGAVFVFLSMWIYTESFLVTFMTIVAIGLSLGISYFFYTIIFNLRFFPFMNLLACVVAVGIGADDAFIYCKIWSCIKSEKSDALPQQIVQESFRHALLSMFITSFTTAVAFLTSFVSSITAIRCFSVFAGMAVVANLGLMVTWLPACVCVSERLSFPNLKWFSWELYKQGIRPHLLKISSSFNETLVNVVVRCPLLWVFVFGILAVVSGFSVLYYPGLQLPTSPDFQLFSKSHPFELYDKIFREKFRFENLEKLAASNVKLPLRFVWGVKPADSGDYFNPYSKGKLQFDPTFDMSDSKSQVWLKQFCRQVRSSPFYQPTSGPLLQNCYIESLERFMDRPCNDIDQSPCCGKKSLPYKRSVFKNCTIQAMASLYSTPHDFFDPGFAGPKFSKNASNPKIRAVIIEYDSNFSYLMSYEHMNTFFNEVENFMQEELNGAPPGMKHGWFVSDLHFYDLQHTVADSTVSALLFSMVMALLVLFGVTLDVVVSLFAVLSVTCTIFVTMAVLLLFGWELNVLESVAISTSIGLAVDFSLHYSLSYRLAPNNANREEAVKYALHHMSGPTCMGALTTGIAGVFMLPSKVLAYIQIGMFLVTVMVASWIYATFFLMSLLCLAGPRHGFGQFSYQSFMCCIRKRSSIHRSPSGALTRSDKSAFSNVLSESTSNTTYPLHSSASEGHELDALTLVSKRSSQSRKRSGSFYTSRPTRTTSDQSPSANSACTVILFDDADLSRQHM